MAEKLENIEKKLENQFKRIDDIAFYNQKKVLNAFNECKISAQCFYGSTGYGYGDIGKEKLAEVFAKTFGAEKAIVSPLLTCGTHTISTVLYGLLKRNDIMLSITGLPYDTIQSSIFGKDNNSLEDIGVIYRQIDLNDDSSFNIEKISKEVKKYKPKVVYLQRSKGYANRLALSPYDMEEVFKLIKKISPNSFIVVDNCYGEFVDKIEPTQVGADVIMGSLIKNPGGGLAQTGGYIAGSEKAIDLISTRFTNPSLKLETGSYEMGYRMFYQGFFLSPHVVAQALKGVLLIGGVMSEKGFKVLPSNDIIMQDIVKAILFEKADDLIKFVQTVQKCSPVDGYVLPLPWDMPGYKDQVIMAAGTFVGGGSIELSCDGPIRKPYTAYIQGGLTYEHVRVLAEKLLQIY